MQRQIAPLQVHVVAGSSFKSDGVDTPGGTGAHLTSTGAFSGGGGINDGNSMSAAGGKHTECSGCQPVGGLGLHDK